MKREEYYLASLEELARRTAEGDTEAFAELYRALLDGVYAYIFFNLKSREEAEDLSEEVFLRCLTNISGFDPRKASLKTWVFRIARNLVVDHQRRRRRRTQVALEEASLGYTPSLTEHVEEEERHRFLRQALSQIPDLQRQVLTMKFFAGMDNKEVAAVLGKSEGAVNALQHRGLRKLGALLEERGWRE